MATRLQSLCILAASALTACESAERDLITSIPTDITFHASALQKEAHVIRTEAGVPHIYAASRHDAAYIMGFTTARDRFFLMDLARRAAEGTVSELLGDAGLDTDLQSRTSGITYLADQLTAGLTPTLQDHVDAYAQGVNDYITQVQTNEASGTDYPKGPYKIEAPSEYQIAAGFLGVASPGALMKPFARRDVVAIVAYTVYSSSFETGDIEHTRRTAALPNAFAGARDEALRKLGLDLDIWSPVAPLYLDASAPGPGTTYGSHAVTPGDPTTVPRLAKIPNVSKELLTRLSAAVQKQQVRFNRDRVSGYGSNAWAVAGFATKNGNAIMAGDGHLSLATPPTLYQFGVDTTVFGDGDLHQLGLTVPGFPLMAIGSNGKVAWSQTQLGEDITDWYREIIQLDANGVPMASRWGTEWKPLERIDETYTIAGIVALGSVGRTETWSRFRTFDGRWLGDFEGRVVKSTDPVGSGEKIVRGLSGYVVPGDSDGDGTITAISFNYAGHSAGQLLSATDALGHATDVESFREATKGLVGYSQNFAVSDSTGNILYTSYQTIPCRRNLPRNPDGSFIEGADPTLLLDGTKYGSWSIPIKNGKVDETVGETDPSQCVIPFDKTPQSVNPDVGFVATANNDPGGITFDGSIYNQEYYYGGPWDEGFRVDTISRSLKKDIAAKRVGIESMAQVQANVDSRLGELFTGHVLKALAHAKASTIDGTESESRMAVLYGADAGAYDEIARRLSGWRDRGFQAKGGVKTFYRSPTPTDVEDSIATMLFNAWLRNFMARVMSDEGIDDLWGSIDGETKMHILSNFLNGRGDGGGALVSSWEPTRKESVYFDDLRTPDQIESSDEDILNGLADALTFLRSPPDPKSSGNGGFGTADMTQYIWGLRHQVEFKSLISDFLGSSSNLDILTSQLGINTDMLPLASPGETIDPSDPRASLHWFPRDGDEYGVDAANPGIDGTSFHHGSGPVMRMIFELSPTGVHGQNIIPGGQSGITTSPHYTDQLRLWLQDTAYPVRFGPSAVAEGATLHEVFLPSGQ